MASSAEAPLDMGGIFKVEVKAEGDKVTVGLKTHPDYSNRFPGNLIGLSQQLKARANGRLLKFNSQSPDSRYYYTASFERADHDSPATVDISIGENPCQQFTVQGDNVTAKSHIQLPVEIVRGIAEDRNYKIPEIDKGNYDYALQTARTQKHISTHTHFSADDPKQELVDLATEKNIPIPRRFLDKIGVDYQSVADKIKWEEQPTIFFFPKRYEQKDLPPREPAVGLRDLVHLFPEGEAREKFKHDIVRRLSIPIDEIRHQGGYEDIYEVLEFATKRLDEDIIARRIANVARSRQGPHENCGYMEITSGSVMRKEFILGWQKAVQELAREGLGFDAELKLGVPRHMKTEEMIDNFSRAIAYHKQGLCCGIDIMGNEDNKTADFAPALKWLGENLKKEGLLDSFTVQVHAGETSKNPDNVNEVLQLALDYGFRLNIGHSIIGWNEKTIDLMSQLARNNQITVQLLHGSNISLSATHSLAQVPWKLLVENHIPTVVDTDGAIYNTHYQSLLASLASAGAGKEVFDHIAESQKAYAQHRRHWHEELQKSGVKDWSKEEPEALSREIDTIEANLPPRKYTDAIKAGYAAEQLRKQTKLEEVTLASNIMTEDADIAAKMNGKFHIMVFGSTGSSWKNKDDSLHKMGLSEAMRNEITIGQEMMVRALDPKRVTFGIGRTKEEGAAEKLVGSLQAHPEKNFFTVAYVVRAEDLVDDARHELIFNGKAVKAIRRLGGDLVNLAPQIVDIATKDDKRAILLEGGLRSTDDIARLMLASKKPDNLMLMRPEGVSGMYARKLPESFSFGFDGSTRTFDDVEALKRLWLRKKDIFEEEYRNCGDDTIEKKLIVLRTQVEADLGIKGIKGNNVYGVMNGAGAQNGNHR